MDGETFTSDIGEYLLPTDIRQWKRKGKPARNLNDYVEELHALLLDGQSEEAAKYARLLSAVHDEQSVEGSLSSDNQEAARMIRDLAKEKSSKHPLAGEKLRPIVKSLGIVMRRWGVARKDRREAFNGKPEQNGKDGE